MNIQVLLGTLLGDATIYKDKRGFFSFSVEHSNTQESYINWKSEQLKIFNLSYRERKDRRTQKTYKSIILHKGSKDFEPFYNAFYKKKKEISREILDELNSLGIAIWYCDDGSCYYNSNNCHITLALNGYSDDSRKIVIKWFKEKYNLDFKITTQGAIRLTSKKHCEVFMDIIENFIPDCMKYKKLNNQMIKYYAEKRTKKILYG
jgi:LAGLIDADG DNA endonuclease family protein